MRAVISLILTPLYIVMALIGEDDHEESEDHEFSDR